MEIRKYEPRDLDEMAQLFNDYRVFYEQPADQELAKRLLQAAAARAKIDGKVRMDLTTAKTNLKAHALYESLGWKRDEIFYTYNLPIG